MGKLLRDRYLWYIVSLIVSTLIMDYQIENSVPFRTFFGLPEDEAHLLLQTISNGVFLAAIVIAAWRYRFRGGLAVAIATELLLLPHTINGRTEPLG